MITKKFSIKNFQNWSSTGVTWSYMKPITNENGLAVYSYMENNALLTEDGIFLLMENENVSVLETTDEIVSFFTVFFGRKIDNIGIYTNANEEWLPYTYYNSGSTVNFNDVSFISLSAHTSESYFNGSLWAENVQTTSGNTITFTGDTKISYFKRYGKNENDFDLYNPTWNTGYTFQSLNNSGSYQQITNEKTGNNGKQKLYEYKFWTSGNTGSTVYYNDIDSENSEITYTSSGMTPQNSISGGNIKNENLLGLVNLPKTDIDIFIERGSNFCFEKHIKLGNIRTLDDFENYGNGEFPIKDT